MLETFLFTIRIMKKRPLRSLLTILQLGLGVWVVCGPVVPQFPSGRYGGRRPRAVVRLLGKTDRV